ncbi:glycosyltransferase [Nitrososphaera sp.]|uniref:glycosyltransferase n=1 Tax=Nitrososphaera sp. TaxID=1971748 RepID=UPI00317B6076
MSTGFPLVSIIIPCKSIGRYEDESVDGCLALKWPNVEILILPDEESKNSYPSNVRIIPTGKIKPALKRNIGIKQAKGDYIAFLDSDAYPIPEWLDNAIPLFAGGKVGLVGGPSLTPPADELERQASGLILASKIGGGGLANRYVAGKSMPVDDIPSSNMITTKSVMEKLGGFNADYWPGEDTYFCLQIKRDLGMEILYSPQVVVYHHRRRVFRSHLQQIWGYGTHRGYFAKKFPYNSRRPTYFVPSLFVLFNAAGIMLSFFFPHIFLVPYLAILGAYFVMCIASGAKANNAKLGLMVTIGIPLTHVVYGVGFLKGLTSDLKH